jgi:hypothetical protein
MKIVRWATYAESNVGPQRGWMGGFMSPGMGWDDYLARFDEGTHGELCALRDAIIERGARFGGDYHQLDHFDGVPLMDDGTYYRLSFRAWGDLLAAAWNSVTDGRPYDYMDFYMGPPRDEVKP